MLLEGARQRVSSRLSTICGIVPIANPISNVFVPCFRENRGWSSQPLRRCHTKRGLLVWEGANFSEKAITNSKNLVLMPCRVTVHAIRANQSIMTTGPIQSRYACWDLRTSLLPWDEKTGMRLHPLLTRGYTNDAIFIRFTRTQEWKEYHKRRS